MPSDEMLLIAVYSVQDKTLISFRDVRITVPLLLSRPRTNHSSE